MISKTCCFTGHRPDKLYGYDLGNPKYRDLFKKVENHIIYLIESKGVNRFITGGALGFDTLAFLVVESLKDRYEIENILAVPFKNQDVKWFQRNRELYSSMLDLADKVIEVDKEPAYIIQGIETETYHPAKMQKRNEFMVNNSKYVIACWNGSRGGTGNTINYVKGLGNRNCIIIEP